ncbi:hypothetical protein MERGE_003045 [Pneumocystis wakefieldiae]|uniref:Uncharacterized protein n=1 Tax=Pneumocystis wakefieldiae TaxID=38082 RepID=A0A899G3K2_9ASCO|nr:hypothetical protein MERGE_003045 [Pneumocystis wakefieldiae]
MRHHSLHHLFQRSKTPLKLPWSSCPVAVNPLDLAVSLIWSQHRPLALFHQNQEIHGDEPLVAPKIPAKPCKTSFVWPEKIQQKLNFLKTNSSNELLFQTTLWPLLPYYFERKLLFYPTKTGNKYNELFVNVSENNLKKFRSLNSTLICLYLQQLQK